MELQQNNTIPNTNYKKYVFINDTHTDPHIYIFIYAYEDRLKINWFFCNNVFAIVLFRYEITLNICEVFRYFHVLFRHQKSRKLSSTMGFFFF